MMADHLTMMAISSVMVWASLDPVVHNGGCRGDDDGALGVGLGPPGHEMLLGFGDLGHKLFVDQGLKRLQVSSGSGVDAPILGSFDVLDVHSVLVFSVGLQSCRRSC